MTTNFWFDLLNLFGLTGFIVSMGLLAGLAVEEAWKWWRS